MSLVFKLAVYLPVLFLVAIVVVGQHHTTASATLQDAVRRTGRWLGWSAALVGVLVLLQVLFIGW